MKKFQQYLASNFLFCRAQTGADEEVEFNVLADEIISEVANRILTDGLDPARLDDQSVTFEYVSKFVSANLTVLLKTSRKQ